MQHYVGIDCGGSMTRVMAVDENDEVVFRGLSGPGNLSSTPRPKIQQHLVKAMEGCPNPDYLCGCFAGLINEDGRRLAESILRQLFPEASLRVEPDFAAALYASPPGTDVCVIAGTGSLVCSQHDERIVKSGGRGYILGDLGSAYQLGRDAIVYFLDHPNAASEPFKNAIVSAFGSTREDKIVSEVYASATPARTVAQFAKYLALAASEDDPAAVDSVRRHMASLAAIVIEHVETYFRNQNALQLSIAGGIWNTSPIVQEIFSQELQSRTPDRHFAISRLTQPPVMGAVELAKLIPGNTKEIFFTKSR